ncbi:hypothetical protein [Agriterribacter sp.]|uniref:hypothetical protein n=1 Tax=Agriterribacter sp. TaxID=2821509 RepID=UPI002C160AFC|nr:hypothetical protein [Agriterribacter sp.]HRP56396.1 hypothetical protein [Agriterribacter sp.]
MKKIGLFLVIILTANILLLYSHSGNRGPFEFDYNYIKINKYMGIRVNPDAFTFIGVAINPGYLFQDGYLRQSRPVYALIGSVIGYSIYYATYPLHAVFEREMKKSLDLRGTKSEENKGVLYFCFYLGYVLLNFLILLCSLLLFDRLIHITSGYWKNGKLLYILILLMIAGNHETKYFFWTPHQQLFNILTPLLSLYAGIKIIQNHIPSSKLFLYSFLSGCALLIYGNFLLLFITILASGLYIFLKNNQLNYRAIIIRLTVMIFLFSIPTVSWILFLKSKGINFTSSELDVYRQFIWIADATKVSPQYLFYSGAVNTWYFLQTFGSLLLPLLLLLITVLYFLKNNISFSVLTQRIAFIPFVICIAHVLFFWLLGYYADRLTFSLVPFILYYFILLINQQKVDKKLEAALILSSCISFLWIVFFEAPHFSTRLLLN